MIGEWAFANCESLKHVIFDLSSTVTEIQPNAFYHSDLKSFTAPPSLRRIGGVAFRDCCNLKTFEFNEGIQELGGLCLLEAGGPD